MSQQVSYGSSSATTIMTLYLPYNDSFFFCSKFLWIARPQMQKICTCYCMVSLALLFLPCFVYHTCVEQCSFFSKVFDVTFDLFAPIKLYGLHSMATSLHMVYNDANLRFFFTANTCYLLYHNICLASLFIIPLQLLE